MRADNYRDMFCSIIFAIWTDFMTPKPCFLFSICLDDGNLFRQSFLLPPSLLRSLLPMVEKAFTERTAAYFLDFGLGFVRNSKLGIADWMTSGLFHHRVLVLNRWIAQYAITVKVASDTLP
jgi:hypothetical protein